MADGLPGQHLWQRALGGIYGHGEGDADVDLLPGGVLQGRVDAYYPSLAVQQGAARVAGVHGGIGLEHIPDGAGTTTGREGAAGGTDDPLSEGPFQGKGVADGQDGIARADSAGVA